MRVKILHAGDTHGDLHQAHYLRSVAHAHGCGLIIVHGDFQYVWEGYNTSAVWSERSSRTPAVPVWVLPGNHEDWAQLDHISPAVFSNGVPHGGELAPGVTYLGRTNRFVIDGVRFLSIGGAFSVDKDHHRVGITWFPQETISEADIHRATADGDTDVLLSHDAPTTPVLQDRFDQMHAAIGRWFPAAYDLDSARNRAALETIIGATHPNLVIHGHYHFRYTTTLDSGVRVEGLGCNGSGEESWMITDTQAMPWS